jgi:CBS domain-containing protein
MTRDPLACLATETVARAAKVMKTLDVGSVPVVDNKQTKRLIGMVTDRDLALKVVAEERNPVDVKIGEVMTRELVTCRADDDLEKAIALMASNQLRRIPVIDSNRVVIGIIAQADVATKIEDIRQTGAAVKEISRRRASLSHSAGA